MICAIVETDAKKTVHDAIHSKEEDVLEFGQIISECINQVNREANEATDALVKLASSLGRLNNWGDVPQPIKQNVVERDVLDSRQ